MQGSNGNKCVRETRSIQRILPRFMVMCVHGGLAPALRHSLYNFIVLVCVCVLCAYLPFFILETEWFLNERESRLANGRGKGKNIPYALSENPTKISGPAAAMRS